MRIHFASKNHCAHLAKSLKRQVSPIISTVKLSDCQNAVGRMMGYRNWHEFEARCSADNEASPFDEVAPASLKAARRIQFVGALASSIGLRVDQAGAIIDRVGPMSSRPPSHMVPPVDDDRDPDVQITLFEGAWGTGVALSSRDEFLPSTGTYLLLGYADGRISLFGHPTFVTDAGQALGLVKKGGLKPNPNYEHAFNLLGYRSWDTGRSPGRDPRSADDREAEARRIEARAHIERHLDLPKFRAWSDAPGYATTPWCYDGLREEASGSTRRATFAEAYPAYLNHIIDLGRDRSFALVDDAIDPRDAVATWLSGARGLEKDAAVEILERLGPLHVRSEFGEMVRDGYVLLWHLGPDHTPTSQDELDAFAQCHSVFRHAFSGRALDEITLVAGILADAKGIGCWRTCYERIVSEATRCVGRLVAEGVEFVGEDDVPEDVVIRFYKVADNCMSNFAWDTVEPAIALTNDLVRELHEGGDNYRDDGITVLPPTQFENACTKLFLEEIGFDDLVSLATSWHIQYAAQGYRSKPSLNPISQQAVEKRLDTWRPFLRPQYRNIGLEGVLRCSAEGMARQKAVIGRRKGSRPSTAEISQAGKTIH